MFDLHDICLYWIYCIYSFCHLNWFLGWIICIFVGRAMPIPLIGILLLMLLHIGFQHETELLEDSLALPGFPPFSCKFGSSEEEYVDSDDLANSRPRTRPSAIQNPPLTDSNLVTVPSGSMKQEFRRRHVPHGWLHKMVLPKLFCSNHIVFLLFCESPPPFPPHPLFTFYFLFSSQ